MPQPPLYLAVEVDGDGDHPAAWRRAAHAPGELLTPRRVARVAAAAENAGFTLVTLDDSLLPPAGDATANIVGRIGAVERAAFVAASTSVLGIAPIASTTYAEPFHLSSQLATLDHISAGRAAWVATADKSGQASTDAARAWGRPPVEGAEAVGREARDAIRVVRDLWDSWEDDAVIRSVATSRYLDRDRLHYIDFTGDTYTVKGPGIVPRPPQGRPVVLAREGLVPPELIDVALVDGASPARLGEAAARSGAPLAFAEVEVALDTPGESAEERVADLERHAPWHNAPHRLRHVGSAAGLVALLTELSHHVDGVRLRPLVLDEDLSVLSRLVLPELFARRVAGRPLPGATLRTTLGLPRPASRFAAPRADVGADVADATAVTAAATAVREETR
ncbi:LLM class flavin-dependent oxidoreductase [Streptomyces sp. NPDC006464]|uniref:LLM class flavin-dependent oxidoreductase n=1 Tax=Streptomyces sp. NPDC006464 TaxID=3154305 RepID=UPI0033A9BD66